MGERPELVVIGGGIAGSAVALAHAAGGGMVTVVDGERPGAAATGAAAGMLVPDFEAPDRGPLQAVLREALRMYPGWVARLESLSGCRVGLRRPGMLVANLTEEEHREAVRSIAATNDGDAPALLTPAEARPLEPAATPHARSYLWLSDAAQVDAQALAGALRAALIAAGVRVVSGVRVVGVMERGGRAGGVVLEDGRTIGGEAVVLAAGAWSGQLREIARRVPVRPVRGHILRYRASPDGPGRMIGGHGGRYVVPRADGTVVAGSTMEEAGFDRSLCEEAMDRVATGAAALAPVLAHVAVGERWADLRPVALDGLPVVGPDPVLEGLFHATGYGRTGILLAPHAGRAVAEMVCGDAPAGWEAFSPARVG